MEYVLEAALAVAIFGGIGLFIRLLWRLVPAGDVALTPAEQEEEDLWDQIK